MEETKIRGYVHLAKISNGTELFGSQTKNTYRFSTCFGMHTATIGVRKLLHEVGNTKLVKFRKRDDATDKANTKQEVDVFIAKRDLPNLSQNIDVRFICFVPSSYDSIDDFKDFISIASI